MTEKRRDHARDFARYAGSVWLVVAVSVVLNAAGLFGFYQKHPDIRYFTHMGSRFVTASHSSSVIRFDPHFTYDADHSGYDGQFFYYLALDPVHAKDYIRPEGANGPAYRYGRILYPMLARLLAAGRAPLIPYMLLLINLVSIAVGTYLIGRMLQAQGLSPLPAFIYGLFPGLTFALHHDLSEPLAYALVIGAIYTFKPGQSRAILLSGLLFGLAALARETTLVFAIPFAVSVAMSALHGRRAWAPGAWGRAALFGLLAVAPYAVYKVGLFVWLHSWGTRSDTYPATFPLGGLIARWPFNGNMVFLIVLVVIPGLICGSIALAALIRGYWTPLVWALLLNVLVNVVFLNAINYSAYAGTGRLSASIVLSALLALPTLDQLTRGNRLWLWVTAACWLAYAPFYLFHVPLWILAPCFYLIACGPFLARYAKGQDQTRAAPLPAEVPILSK